jgi:hypothetical protein
MRESAGNERQLEPVNILASVPERVRGLQF